VAQLGRLAMPMAASRPAPAKGGVHDVDAADIRASLDGDGDAYSRLVKRYERTIAAQLWRLTRDKVACEELVQDVFVEAYFGLRKFRHEAPLEHWLRAIATRVGYRYLKQLARERAKPHVSLEDWDHVAAPTPEADPAEAAALLHALLAQLPPRDQLVLTLLYFEGCSTKDAAALTGWSPTMVRVQAHRARKKLKSLAEREKLLEKVEWPN